MGCKHGDSGKGTVGDIHELREMIMACALGHWGMHCYPEDRLGPHRPQ
jgi:hypothetical protein